MIATLDERERSVRSFMSHREMTGRLRIRYSVSELKHETFFFFIYLFFSTRTSNTRGETGSTQHVLKQATFAKHVRQPEVSCVPT